MEVYISAISYYLPEKVLTNENLITDFPEWTVEKVASKIGIKERHIAADEETAMDMGINAAIKLFLEHNIDRSSIDFLLFCTQSPDYFLPSSACLMQERLGLSTSCGAFDFNLGCSGFVYGLSIAKGLIAGGIATNVLLITSETYSKYIYIKDKGNRTIFGDAATATLISSEGFAQIESFSLGTDGRGAENLIVKTGAMRNPQKADLVEFDEGGNPVSSDHLYMNGSEIFSFTLETVPILVENTLVKNNLKKENIDLFVFHQANKYLMNFLRKKLKVEEDKFFYFLENVGNTVSSTIPIALYEAQKENKLKGNILLAGFGVGYSWGGVILKVL
jgi:3-oxoacyl-[acyl-carrier-protein] synthase III